MPDVFFLQNIGISLLRLHCFITPRQWRTRELSDLGRRGPSCLEKVTNARMRECKRTQIAQKIREKNVPKIFIKSLFAQ